MSWDYTHYILPLLFPGVMAGVLVLYILPRTQTRAKPLMALAAAGTLWSLGHAAELMGADLPTKLLCNKIEYVAIGVLPVAWLCVALQYAGRRHLITVQTMAPLALLAAVGPALAWTNEWHGLVWRDMWLDTTGPFCVLVVVHGPGYFVYMAYSYLLFLAGGVLLALTALNSPALFFGQRVALLLALAFPLTANILYVTRLGPVPDLTSFAFALSTVALGLGVFRLQLTDVVPLARGIAMDRMPEAIIVLDHGNHIVDMNASAETMAGKPLRALAGLPIKELFGEHLPLEECLRADSGLHTEIRLEKDGAARDYSVRLTAIRDKRGLAIGQLLVCRDGAELRRAEEALRRERAFSTLLMERSPAFVLAVDADGRTRMANEALLSTLGYTEQEVVGEDALTTLVAESEREIVAGILGPLTADGVSALNENRVVAKNGSEYIVQWHGGPVLREDGAFDFFFAIGIDITERKRTEKARRESEEKYRGILDSMQEAYYETDLKGRLTFFNPAMSELLGYPADELQGMGYRHYYVDEQTAAQVFEVFNQVYETGKPVRLFDWGLSTSCGATTLVEASVALRRDADNKPIGFRGVIRDIAERKRAEEALRESEAKYRSILDSVQEGYYETDLAGRLTFFNPALCDILGYPADELQGMGYRRYYVDERTVTKVYEAFNEVYKTGRPAQVVDWELTRKSGATAVVEASIALLRAADGQAIGFRGVLRDITERKRAERTRLDLERQVQQAQKLESLGVLAGGIAHDFNNILAAILGYADLVAEDLAENHPAQLYVDEIVKGTERAADLTRQMLAYSGRGRFVVGKLDLSSLIEGMANFLQTTLSKKVTFNLHLQPNLPAIEGDASQIDQVILNLITNASEAIGDMAGVISLSTGRSDCNKARLANTILAQNQEGEPPPPGTYVFFEVSDTGCGMDENTRSKIFEPFFSTKFSGRGLGMAAVLGIVRGHAGAVELDTEPGKGTTFRFLFPAAEGEAPEAAAGVTERADRQNHTEGATVLIVDDEAAVRRMVADYLERHGFSVLTAGDGRQALDMYRAHTGAIACVLLDLTMPVMDGVECLHELRQIDPEVRVILSSGYTEQDATKRFSAMGLASFLKKPYSLSLLGKRVEEALYR